MHIDRSVSHVVCSTDRGVRARTLCSTYVFIVVLLVYIHLGNYMQLYLP